MHRGTSSSVLRTRISGSISSSTRSSVAIPRNVESKPRMRTTTPKTRLAYRRLVLVVISMLPFQPKLLALPVSVPSKKESQVVVGKDCKENKATITTMI